MRQTALQLPVEMLLSALMPSWREAGAVDGQARHSSSGLSPRLTSAGRKEKNSPPLKCLSSSPHAFLPTYLPACLCRSTSAQCSHNTSGTCRLIFYLSLPSMHLTAAHTHFHTSPRPPSFELSVYTIVAQEGFQTLCADSSTIFSTLDLFCFFMESQMSY